MNNYNCDVEFFLTSLFINLAFLIIGILNITEHRHFLIHKPYGFISQFTSGEKLAHKKKYLGDLYTVPKETMAIGRLDEPSEGLLLLTTDGKESERVRSKSVEKEYHVQLDGIITKEAILLLTKGVEIGVEGKKYQTLPCCSNLIETPLNLPNRRKKVRDDRHGPTSWASIVITEGKFRQVRKMFSAVGFPVLRLIRVRVGQMHLNQITDEGILEVSAFNL
ncbi:23S rRNA pseudouridine2457 synthase [Wenyingzhuangia heitensis]|uniref:Pseudouridine synthase n=1 Tax=Wenyingzhuangia heitensis TaxID=1487859 RepID=A0ABX0UBA0_9FLAO|nr:pseudouridine synthase [Wenyingzhuangia heitensis]NIJ44741.1 23S rRNA pseudouridine2457 synthase [Wenyingzhuangia heitensis]